MRTLKAPANPLTFWLGVLVLGLLTGLGIQFATAWTAPTAAPPGGNVAAPITTQGDQTKNGRLYVKSTADAPNFPAGWGGGVASYDFYADGGSFGAGYNGSLNFLARRDGYVSGVNIVANGGMWTPTISASSAVYTPTLCLNGTCKSEWPAEGGWLSGMHCGLYVAGLDSGSGSVNGTVLCQGYNPAYGCPAGFARLGGDYQSPGDRYMFTCVKY